MTIPATSDALNITSPIAKWAAKDREQLNATKAKEGDKTFLLGLSNLLMTLTQSAHSNPMNPASPAEMAKLMQGLVDVQMMLHKSDDETNVAQELRNTNLLQASSLVGKDLTVESDSFRVQGGRTPELSYIIPPGVNPNDVTISIFPENGGVMKRFAGETEGGTHTIPADKLSDLPEGTYYFDVQAKGANQEGILVTQMVQAPLQGITKQNGDVMLDLGHERVPLSQILRVY